MARSEAKFKSNGRAKYVLVLDRSEQQMQLRDISCPSTSTSSSHTSELFYITLHYITNEFHLSILHIHLRNYLREKYRKLNILLSSLNKNCNYAHWRNGI
jgi:hypothetical protein